MVPAKARAWAAVVLIGSSAATSCAINPATGQNQFMLVSEDQGIAMGREADPAIIATIGLYEDAAWQSYIQQFGEKLAATSERPDLPWTFRVVEDPAVNAFAVPDGFVYVTRGLLAHLTSEAAGGGRLPNWLSTHPSPGNRVATITEQIAGLPQDFPGTIVNRDSYLQSLDGLMFGTNPREGYFQGSRFFHPNMRFQLTFPEGWTTQNGALRGMVLFVEHGGTVFGIIGYATENRWSTYQAVVERSLRSFAPLTDLATLDVQPQRLDILKLDRRTTIGALTSQRSSPVSAATLALINQVELGTPLEAGRLVKWVIGPTQPRQGPRSRPG